MPTDKDKAIYFLKCLIELVENDRVRVEELEGKTADQIIELAEIEANKAVAGSQDLKDGR